MTTKVNPKGSLHFTYTAGFRIDPEDRNGSLGRAQHQIVANAREHYGSMFPDEICAVVIEEPTRVLVEPTQVPCAHTRAGYIILEVDVGVFFDFIAEPWKKEA